MVIEQNRGKDQLCHWSVLWQQGCQTETSGTEKFQESNHKTLSGSYKHAFNLLYAVTENFLYRLVKARTASQFCQVFAKH